MNKTEQLAHAWLLKQPNIKQLVFQRRDSPDFIDQNGNGYESKLLRDNAITFTEGQLEKLLRFSNVVVLLMSHGKPEPVASIPIKDLENSPAYWKHYHIVSYPSYQHPITQHYCEQCGAEFKVKQGSRQRYCEKCLIIRIKHIKE